VHISYANERIIFEAIEVIESMASTPLNASQWLKNLFEVAFGFPDFTIVLGFTIILKF
jgi:hypothetical protein